MTDEPRPFSSSGDPLLADALRQEAGRCVACGYCLPACPTYRKTLNEADSPRGRIFMMAAALEGRLALSPELLGHLDLCLVCRACENACPSQVRYGRLMDGMRAWLEPQRQRPAKEQILRRTLFATTAQPTLLNGLGALLRTYQATGLARLARASGALEALGLASAEGQVPPLRPVREKVGFPPASAPSRGRVGLFLGCAARLTDGETLSAALFLLRRLGYEVAMPGAQRCCGALHRHGGEAVQAEELASANREAFAGLDFILHAASGCGATLAEYEPPLPAPVMDVTNFLARSEGWKDLDIPPLDAAIAVQEPCTSLNVLHDQDGPYALLARIPGAAAVPLAGNDQCCGAAGSYVLTQPEMSALLLRDKIEAIKASGARYIATTNPGCSMHLAGELRREGVDIEVLHPVTLVARQLGFNYAG